MRAYLINPETSTVTEVDYSGDWREIAPILDCQNFDVVSCLVPTKRGPVSQDIFVDDEGLLTNPPPTFFFLPHGFHSPLAGKGLVLGHDNEGEAIGSTLTLEEVSAAIHFYTLIRTIEFDIEPVDPTEERNN